MTLEEFGQVDEVWVAFALNRHASNTSTPLYKMVAKVTLREWADRGQYRLIKPSRKLGKCVTGVDCYNAFHTRLEALMKLERDSRIWDTGWHPSDIEAIHQAIAEERGADVIHDDSHLELPE